MKQLTLLLLLFAFTFAGNSAMAQDSRRENVEAAKIAFLTDKMGLTPDQSQKFWPMYKEYDAKRRELHMAYRKGYHHNVNELSDQQAKARVDEMFAMREKELSLEKEYATKYQRVISTKQLITLYRAEREFTKLLLKRLDDRRGRATQE
ncbi:hypothetical protein [Pontibacter harenae]|uniref:hypothetical protein n=1 Tax=Pontibacter harenae TaxID=2894083 RepID=UPI001E3D5D9E|nr:hypothetical protein [Pontibacter harenae]MCC9165753.1 hypothetical protein [Pontibacter harenae]